MKKEPPSSPIVSDAYGNIVPQKSRIYKVPEIRQRGKLVTKNQEGGSLIL